MFDLLTNKLQKVFKDLRGLGKITENNVGDSLREVRMALLEADVNFKVARDFIERALLLAPDYRAALDLRVAMQGTRGGERPL